MLNNSVTKSPSSKKAGDGLFNKVLNSLPFELHVPGYNYLGPGTKLEERLKRGDAPANPLDAAARDHDIAYAQHQDTENRHVADKLLEQRAWKRVISKDAGLSERSTALLTAGAMRIKRKLGMGTKRPRKSGKGLKKKRRGRKVGHGLKRQRKALSFKHLVKKARDSIKNQKSTENIDALAERALNAAHREIKKNKRKFKLPRVIPVPKSGGALPLVPILAGITALAGAAKGVGSIVKSIGEIAEAKRKIFPGASKKIGNGIYLAPYKKTGFGLYLEPYISKN